MENKQKFAEHKVELKQTADELRARYIKIAKDQDIGIVHIHYDGIKGGMTIAFRKASPYKHGVMVDVAVNVCSIKDAFSRKLGTFGAIQKFLDGETIQLPLLAGTYGDTCDLNWTIKRAFTTLYNIATE